MAVFVFVSMTLLASLRTVPLFRTFFHFTLLTILFLFWRSLILFFPIIFPLVAPVSITLISCLYVLAIQAIARFGRFFLWLLAVVFILLLTTFSISLLRGRLSSFACIIRW